MLVAASVLALLIVVVAIAASGDADTANLGGSASLRSGGVYGVLQSAALLFFAFAGYARIATLGEEVRDPEHTIPRAIPIALGITVALYAAVALAALLVAGGPDALAASTAPLATAVKLADAAWAAPIVRVGAAVASLGALLALIAGIGRTSLAMARHGDLPGWLAAVHPRYRVPGHAELAVAAVVSVLVLTTDLRGAIGFSSFGVLDLLRDRERRRAHPARGEATLAARAERHRARGLRRARGRPPALGGRRRAGRAGRRSRGPPDPAQRARLGPRPGELRPGGVPPVGGQGRLAAPTEPQKKATRHHIDAATDRKLAVCRREQLPDSWSVRIRPNEH